MIQCRLSADHSPRIKMIVIYKSPRVIAKCQSSHGIRLQPSKSLDDLSLSERLYVSPLVSRANPSSEPMMARILRMWKSIIKFWSYAADSTRNEIGQRPSLDLSKFAHENMRALNSNTCQSLYKCRMQMV